MRLYKTRVQNYKKSLTHPPLAGHCPIKRKKI